MMLFCRLSEKPEGVALAQTQTLMNIAVQTSAMASRTQASHGRVMSGRVR